MYQPSQEFITELNKTSRLFRARITCGMDTLTEEIKKMIFTLGSCGADTFTIGSVFASYVDITLSSTETSLAGKEMFVEIGLLLPDETVEYVPMGYFTASPADISKSRDQTILKATDRISSKCGGLYIPSITFPATIQAVMDDVSTQAGVTIKTSLPTTGVIQKEMKNLTYREILGYLSGLLGGFCYADREGNICIAAYPSTSSLTIENERSWTMEMGEEYSVDSLKVIVSEGGEDADGNEVAGVSYSSGSGNGITVSNQYMTESLFNDMKSRVLNYSFCSGTARVLGDPRLDPADAITAINFAGKEFFVPCMSITHEYDGGLATTITTPSQAASDEEVRGPLTQQVEQLAAEMILSKEVVAKKITVKEADLKFATIEKAVILEAEITRVSGELADYQIVIAGELQAIKADITELDTNKITVDYLDANFAQIDLANIKDGCITTAMIGTGVVGAAQIADASVTDAKIVDLTANKITAGTLSVERLEIRGSTNSIVYELNNISGALQAENADTINGEILTERTITADKIVANSITGNEIAANTITANNILAGTITGSEIDVGTITSVNIAFGSITGAEIESGSIKADNIDVTDLFAQDITATGTIAGATLNGATIKVKNDNDVIGLWDKDGFIVKKYFVEGDNISLDSFLEVRTSGDTSIVYIGKKEVGYCNEYGVYIDPDDDRYVENDGRFQFFTEYDTDYGRTVNGLSFGNSMWICSKVDTDYPYKFIIDDLQAKLAYIDDLYINGIRVYTSIVGSPNPGGATGMGYLNNNIRAITWVCNPGGNKYVYAPSISGYYLYAATNGDYNAFTGEITSVARQGSTDIVFFNAYHNGAMRLNLFYVKTNF